MSVELNEARRTYSAPALERGFNVVELLARGNKALTISEIAANLDLTVSEIFRIIVVMERRGWLRKAAGDKYSVAPHVLQVAFKATSAEELCTVAIPYMRELSAASDQSCHLVIRNGDKGLVIARLQNPGPTGFHVRIGTEIDLKTSCSGHVLLAFGTGFGALPLDAQDRPLAGLLNAVRQRGYERMESARTLGVTDISYPIVGAHGEVLAALTVPFLRVIDGSQAKSLDETQALLGDTARNISDEFGAERDPVAHQG
jgi:DNA-binding IclR family transcriptional regulator